MPSFRWSAVTRTGELARGVVEAPDRTAVVDRLQNQGQIVLSAELADGRRSVREMLQLEFGRRRGLDRAGLCAVTRELSIMLAAGQDLDRALRYVADNAADQRTRAVLGQIRDRVRRGSSLAASLAAAPNSFPRLYVGMVRAGEAGASLPATLDRLASLLERERSVTANLRSAMIYPAVLVIAALGSIFFLLDYVLPQFAPIFAQAGRNLPASTRALMIVGAAIQTAGPYLIICLLAASLAMPRLLATPRIRLQADRLLLRLPLIGALLRETLAARLTRTLGTLLQNGMPLIGALGIAREALGNHAAAEAVDAAAVKAKGGGGLAGPLSEAGIFPARTIHLIQLGEEAAQLAAMMLRAADIHEEQARLTVQRMIALTVPIITIVMGLAVAAIIASLLMAMFSLNDLAV